MVLFLLSSEELIDHDFAQYIVCTSLKLNMLSLLPEHAALSCNMSHSFEHFLVFEICHQLEHNINIAFKELNSFLV